MEVKIIENVIPNIKECNLAKKYYGYTYSKTGYNKVNWLSKPIWVNEDIFYYFNGKFVDEQELIRAGCYLFCKEDQLNSFKNKIKFAILILYK